MTDQDLFNQQPDNKLLIDPNKNYLEELVGEGKKYKDLEALAKSRIHADHTIQERERELEEARTMYRQLFEENKQRATLEDRLNELNQHLTSSNHTQNANEADQRPTPITPEEIESLFEKKLSERERQRQEQENYNSVVSKLKEKFGDNYASSLENQISELGLTREYINELARKSPKALIRTLGLDSTRQDLFQSPVTNDRRQESFAPTGAPKRTWSYYKKLKESNPLIYLDRDTQIQMQKDRLALGDAFMDGDFNY